MKTAMTAPVTRSWQSRMPYTCSTREAGGSQQLYFHLPDEAHPDGLVTEGPGQIRSSHLHPGCLINVPSRIVARVGEPPFGCRFTIRCGVGRSRVAIGCEVGRSRVAIWCRVGVSRVAIGCRIVGSRIVIGWGTGSSRVTIIWAAVALRGAIVLVAIFSTLKVHAADLLCQTTLVATTIIECF